MFLKAANEHVIMIFKESCDTENWSNDAEIQLYITRKNYIFKYIKTEKLFLNWNNI